VWWKRYVYHSNTVHVQGAKNHLDKDVYTRWEQDYNLQSVERLEMLDEYLEMGEFFFIFTDWRIC
jgi:hypothetical protein